MIPQSLMHKVALCVEEMAGNVALHSVMKDRIAVLDLLVFNKPREVIVRIRDNRMMFDPVAYLKNHASSDNHFGIRITDGVTDHFEYRRTIGLNNVLMVIRKPDESGEDY